MGTVAFHIPNKEYQRPYLWISLVKVNTQTNQLSNAMPHKSNNEKKKEAEATGRKPKLTKQQENAGKSQTQKREEQKAKKSRQGGEEKSLVMCKRTRGEQ